MLTWIWNPDPGPSGDHKDAVNSCKFGDGYVQRAANGINNDMPVYSLTFSTRGDADFAAMCAFLDQVFASGETFLWTPPKRSQGMFWCSGWKETPCTNGISTHTITATFERTMA